MTARPDRDGDEQLGLLGTAWEGAAQHWQDEVARQFDADHWTPLAQRSRAYLAALGALLDVLETAERETEF
jgi:hypothetical protein